MIVPIIIASLAKGSKFWALLLFWEEKEYLHTDWVLLAVG